MIVGIDLGTTNSEIAVSRDGRVTVLQEDGAGMLPSCVGITPDGRLAVGAEARNQYVLRPSDTVRSIKRKMGSVETVTLGGKPYTPTEISAVILRELKGRAERVLREPVSQAVVTVPAYFNDIQRQATREAGVLAGLDVLRIVNEPTAAALAYEAAGVSDAHNLLVYDFGGGTFDVSLLNVTGEVVEVIASHGDNHLGGDDIDSLLLEHALQKLREASDGQTAASVAVNRLRVACEQLKIDLSSSATATLAETGLPMENGSTADLAFDISRREFEQMTAHLLRRTLESVRTVLSQAGMFPSAIDEILMVGGTTRIPAIVDMLEAELSKRPRFSVDPDLAVAFGAGVMAARLAGEHRQRILVDVTPYTFGTSHLGYANGSYGPNAFTPIIKAGTPLPAQRGQVFYTAAEAQREIDVRVFQGESDDARKNVLVGNFLVKGLDTTADSGSPIMLNMRLDLDGILTVSAVEQHTGLTKSVTLKNTLRTMTEEDLSASRRKIAAMFEDKTPAVFEDDEIPVRLQGDSIGEMDIDSDDAVADDGTDTGDGLDSTLRRRIEAVRGDLDASDTEDIEKQIEALRVAVQSGDDQAAQQARETIEDILFYVE